MNLIKQKRFNEKMGKRQKMSKGGLIKKIAGRHYFDDGGTVLSGPSGSNTGTSAATVNNTGLTGTVSNLLGLNNQFQGQSANIQQGTNAAQLNNAYTGAQSGITQQQNLANTLTPQAATGVGTQNALTGQLEGVINGTGPNAAQAALNQNTQTNVANQAALMAGQRGASANTGLLARQAAMQGATTQQQAVEQAATLQAQQQIAAQQQLAGLAANQVGQASGAIQGVNTAQQNEQGILQGANTAANNAAVAQQSNINNVNAQTAQGNQAQANTTLSGIAGGLSNIPVAGALLGGFLAKGGEVHDCSGASCKHAEHAQPAMMASGGPLAVAPAVAGPVSVASNSYMAPQYSSPASPPSSNPNAIEYAGHKAKDKKSLESSEFSDVTKGADTTPGSIANAGNNYATEANGYGTAPGSSSGDLGAIQMSMPDSGAAFGSAGPSLGGGLNFESSGGLLQDLGGLAPLAMLALSRGGNVRPGPHKSHVANFLYAKGGPVEAMVSPGERYLSPEEVRGVVERGDNPLKSGKKFMGKPKVRGDSLKNDVIPATLEEGGVVIPRHVMNKNNRDGAELFVRRAVHMKRSK
jgi:hypothetical protein